LYELTCVLICVMGCCSSVINPVTIESIARPEAPVVDVIEAIF
jgi:hypothetical protein